MTIRYDIDLKQNVVFMGAYGAISVADLAVAMDEIEALPEIEGHLILVLDLREIKRAFIVREMDRLIDLLTSKADLLSSQAFIVSLDTMHGVGRNFALKALRKKLHLEVFNDYTAAVNWLKKLG